MPIIARGFGDRLDAGRDARSAGALWKPARHSIDDFALMPDAHQLFGRIKELPKYRWRHGALPKSDILKQEQSNANHG
jgi:hypothetical protein